LFKRRQERHSTQGSYKAEAITPWKQVPTNTLMLEPMFIDSLRFKKLSQKEKNPRYKKVLYLYCGKENYEAQDYPIKALASKLVKMDSNNIKLHALLDSGASIYFINKDIVDHHKLPCSSI
jgi:hypothetical protein